MQPTITEDESVTLAPHMEFLQAAVDTARAELGSSEEAETLLDEAKIYQSALASLFSLHKNIGQAILAALWHVHLNGLIQFLGYDVECDLTNWAVDQYGEDADPKYISRLCSVTENIFQDVYSREISGNPYRDDVGLPITVDSLISTYGLVNKLVSIVHAYSQETTTTGQKSELLTVVQNGRRKDVDALRDEVLNKGLGIKLRYRTAPAPDGSLNVFFPNINGDAFHVLIALLGDAAEEVFS
jgi:hypothetical protein